MSNVTQSGASLDPLPLEIDNHADTHCFGRNFLPFSWSGLLCSVSPFLDECSSTEDIEICSAATAYTKETGETIILIFGQGLWFGNRMTKSLINPNQCRSFGIPVCDDPTDPFRPLGFTLDNEELLPLVMEGTNTLMYTRCPTREEMDECRKIFMSDPDHWDPTNVHFPPKRTATISSLRGNDTHSINDDIQSDFDIAMYSISDALCASELTKRVINQVTINQTPVTDAFGKSIYTSDHHHAVTPELISRKWGCGLKTARKTLESTAQFGIRSAIGPLTRRYMTDILQQHHRRLKTTFYTDTMFAKVKSLKGNTCAQIFTDGKGFIAAYPMSTKRHAGKSLRRLIEDVGIPSKIIYDGAKEQVQPGTEFQKTISKYHIKGHQNEAETQKYNRAEDAIRELKRRWKRRIIKRRVPKRVWDFGIVWEAEIISRICRNAHTSTGIERITGDTPDISKWLDFEFYDLCWYWDVPNDWDNPKIGRWIGVSHRVGSAMCYLILTDKGKVVARTTVQHVTKEEIRNEDIISKVRQYHIDLDTKLGNDQYIDNDADFCRFLNDDEHDPETGTLYPNNGLEEPYQGYHLPDIDDIGKADDEIEAANVFDKYVGAEVMLPGPGEEEQMARVIKRLKGNDGTPIGRHHNNPILDTSEYLVEFSDGTHKELTANMIAESMYSQIDSEGRHFQLLDKIIDHRSDLTALNKKDGFHTSKGEIKYPNSQREVGSY